ncbi:MAG: tetratricopeptide repeat protein [Fibrobacterales bacterium]
MNRSVIIVLLWVGLVSATPRDLVLAHKYFKDEVYSAAAEHYRTFLSDNPEKDSEPEARIGLARSLTRLFEYEKASQVYQDFLLSYPLHSEISAVLYERAEVLTKLHKPGAASDLFYKFSQRNKKVLGQRSLYKAAHYSFVANDFESTKGYTRQYLEQFPNGEERQLCMALLGRTSFKESEWSDAIQWFKRSFKLGMKRRNEKRAWLLMARSWSKLSQNDSATVLYKNLLSVADSTDSLALMNEYSGFLYTSHQFKTLIEFLDSKSLAALSERTRFYLLSALVETKNFTIAHTIAQTVVFTDTYFFNELRYLRAKILIGVGEPREGIALFTALGAEGQVRAYRMAGDAYLKDAMYQNAVQSYYRAVDIASELDKKELLLKIAEIYEEKLLRYKVAISVFEEFIQNFPSASEAPHAALGAARCYLREDKLKEASYEYRKLMEDYPSSIEAKEAQKHYNYLSRFKLKDRDEALNHILLVLERGDYSEKPLHVARILEEDLKEYRRALKSYQRYIDEFPKGAKRDYAWLKSGEMYELLIERARYENRTSVVPDLVHQGRTAYETLQNEFPNSSYADDAAYHLLEMEVFNLSAYQNFVSRYHQSNYIPNVLYAMGNSYLKQAESFGGAIALKAVEYFQRILNEDREGALRVAALLGVSKAYYLTNSFPKAEPTLKLLLQEKNLPKEIESAALYYRGLVFMKKKKYSESIRQFKQVQYRFFSTTSAEQSQLQIARAYEAQGEFLSAKKAYNGYIERFTYSDSIYNAYQSLATLHEKEHQWKKAADIYSQFVTQLSTHPRIADALEAQGKLLKFAGEKEAAVETLLAAIAASPKGSKDYLYFHIAEMTLLIDRFKDAEGYYGKALAAAENSRDSAQAMGGQVACFAMLGKKEHYHNTYKVYKDRFDNDPEGHARIIYYTGRAFMDRHDAQKAQKRFEYLSEKFDETTWAGEGIYYLGILAFKKGNFNKALNIFKGYVTDYPEGQSKSDVVFKMATCYYQQKNFLRASDLYRRVLKSGGVSEATRYRAAYNAAIAHEKSNQWAQAAQLYDLLMKDFKKQADNAALYVSAGFCWFNAREFVKARDLFKRALDNPESERIAESHYWYAKTLDRLGSVEEAVKEYYKVNYLYAASGMWALTALFDIGQIYERSGDPGRARKMYQKIVDRDGKSGALGSRAYNYLQAMDQKSPPPKG